MSADEVDQEELGESVERPMLRLFTEYGGDHFHWFVIGLVTSMGTRFLSLVPPLVLGVALDAVFYSTRAYELPLLPDAWIPTTQMGQFWFSAEIMGVAMVLAAVFNFARGVQPEPVLPPRETRGSDVDVSVDATTRHDGSSTTTRPGNS